MNIIALFFSLFCFYVAYLSGFRVIFRRKAYFTSSKKIKKFYSNIYIFNWWFELLQKFPKLEISLALLIGLFFAVIGILFLILALHGPIDGYSNIPILSDPSW